MRNALSVILSIDTEGDNLWARGNERGFRNIDRLPEFQEFCEKLGLRPTYLVAYEVIEDDHARQVIQQLAQHGNCEIGAHLHAWLTPPYYAPLEPPGQHPYLHEYPEELRSAKLETVTQALEQAMGKRPTSYRGGRWSMDAFTMRALSGSGYLADTTVTPFVSWSADRGVGAAGPNFVPAPLWPYHPAAGNPMQPGGLAILEVPVSHRPKGLIPQSVYRAFGRWLGGNPRLWRLTLRCFLNRACRVVHPNPATESADRLLWLAQHVVAESAPVLNLAFHSSELMAGGAPWVRTAQDEKAMRERIGRIVEHLGAMANWRGVTLTGLARERLREPA